MTGADPAPVPATLLEVPGLLGSHMTATGRRDTEGSLGRSFRQAHAESIRQADDRCLSVPAGGLTPDGPWLAVPVQRHRTSTAESPQMRSAGNLK